MQIKGITKYLGTFQVYCTDLNPYLFILVTSIYLFSINITTLKIGEIES